MYDRSFNDLAKLSNTDLPRFRIPACSLQLQLHGPVSNQNQLQQQSTQWCHGPSLGNASKQFKDMMDRLIPQPKAQIFKEHEIVHIERLIGPEAYNRFGAATERASSPPSISAEERKLPNASLHTLTRTEARQSKRRSLVL